MKNENNLKFTSIALKYTILYIIFSIIEFTIYNTSLSEQETQNFTLILILFRLAAGIYLIYLFFLTFKKKENKKNFRFFFIDLILVFFLIKILIAILIFTLNTLIPEKHLNEQKIILTEILRNFLEYTSFSIILIILLNNQQVPNFFQKLKSLLISNQTRFFLFLILILNIFKILSTLSIDESQTILLLFVDYFVFMIHLYLIFKTTINLLKNEGNITPYGV